MTGIDQELGNVQQSELRGQVERGVAIVCGVGVPELFGVVLDDAGQQGEIFEVDGTTDACGGIDPDLCKWCMAQDKVRSKVGRQTCILDQISSLTCFY